jgi:hypothetical protein
MEDKTTLVGKYRLNQTNEMVRLSLFVESEDQTFTSLIKLNNMLRHVVSGNLIDYPLGTNLALQGRRLTITTTIANTSGQVTQQKLTIQLKGGVETFSEVLGAKVSMLRAESYYVESNMLGAAVDQGKKIYALRGHAIL